MSGFCPQADIVRVALDVRFVPIADTTDNYGLGDLVVRSTNFGYPQDVMVLGIRGSVVAVFAGILGFALALAAPLAMASPSDLLRWETLPDPAAQTFDDPFAKLSAEQLRLLISVVRLREQSAKGDQATPEDLDAAEQKLLEVGINADELISQRWAVAERRRKAASAGNPKLDGTTITIAGFAIPGPASEGGTRIAYLVAQPGLCSHVPPPAPNQMLRLRLSGEWFPQRIHEPVAVTGKLQLDPTERTFSVVDGPVQMNTTWSMDVEVVDTGLSPPAPLGFRQGFLDEAAPTANKH
jgi:hypothetical protein